MRGAERDLKNDVSRQIFGQAHVLTATPTVARTGVLAWCATNTTDDTTIELATTASGQAKATTEAEMRYFFVGMTVDIVNALTGAVTDANLEITAIDKSGKVITVASTVTTDRTLGTHAVVRKGNLNAEINGLRFLVNDAAGDKVDGTNVAIVHNVSSATVPAWAAVSVGSSTTPLSEDLIEQAFDKVMTDGDGGEPKLLVGSFEQRRALANKLQAQKRYDGREMTLTSGWRGLNVARGVYVAERYCPDNDLFLIARDEMSWFTGQDFTFDQIDGRVLYKALDNSDAVEARMKAYVNLVATNRNSHCRVTVQSV